MLYSNFIGFGALETPQRGLKRFLVGGSGFGSEYLEVHG